LGVAEIVPFISERINVKLNQENKIKKQQRWQRLAEAASKQCGRIQLPKVGEILSFQDLIQSFSRFDLVLLAYELESGTDLKRSLRKSFKENKLKSILAVVGPEGGFSAAEVKAMQQVGAQSVSLGKNILRTETAAISMLAMMQYELLS
ncbi:MAG: RNA methyltransferase, partial [Chlamydiia bacterium]|nr:RNA methyltransferase [Chlamydiia bacterium]